MTGDDATPLVFSTENPGTFVLASQFGCRQTVDRLEAAVTSRGMKVFTRIDFRKDAEGSGLELRDTELLIFGNPRVGTKLLQENQLVGIELPLKVLAFTNHEGRTLLELSDLIVLSDRYRIDQPGLQTLSKMQKAQLDACREAAGEAPPKN